MSETEILPKETGSAIDPDGNVVPIDDVFRNGYDLPDTNPESEDQEEMLYQEYLNLKKAYERDWMAYMAASDRSGNSGGHIPEPPMPEKPDRLLWLETLFA